MAAASDGTYRPPCGPSDPSGLSNTLLTACPSIRASIVSAPFVVKLPLIESPTDLRFADQALLKRISSRNAIALPTSGPGPTPRCSITCVPSSSGRIAASSSLLGQLGDPLLELVHPLGQHRRLALVAGRAVASGQHVQLGEQRRRRRARSAARPNRSSPSA